MRGKQKDNFEVYVTFGAKSAKRNYELAYGSAKKNGPAREIFFDFFLFFVSFFFVSFSEEGEQHFLIF